MRPWQLAIIAAWSGPALAQDHAPAAPITPAPPVKEKKICRSEVESGSIMSRKTCHTQAEWQAIDAANQQSVNRLRDQNTINHGTVQ